MSQTILDSELEGVEDGEPERATLTITAPELFDEEKEALSRHEQTIENGLRVFLDVGIALNEIRSNGLYRAEYASFEEYCEGRWNFRRNYADRLIRAARVTQTLKEEGGFKVLPETEAQARSLTGLSKRRLIEGWGTLLKQTDNALPNAPEVRDFVNQYKEQIKSQKSQKSVRKPREKNDTLPLKDVEDLLVKAEKKLKELESSWAETGKVASKALSKVADARKVLKQLGE